MHDWCIWFNKIIVLHVLQQVKICENRDILHSSCNIYTKVRGNVHTEACLKKVMNTGNVALSSWITTMSTNLPYFCYGSSNLSLESQLVTTHNTWIRVCWRLIYLQGSQKHWVQEYRMKCTCDHDSWNNRAYEHTNCKQHKSIFYYLLYNEMNLLKS